MMYVIVIIFYSNILLHLRINYALSLINIIIILIIINQFYLQNKYGRTECIGNKSAITK